MRDQRWELRVDPVRCDGIGVCAHLASRLVQVDSWGYPIIADGPVPASGRRSAEAAVTACPRKALFLVPAPAE